MLEAEIKEDAACAVAGTGANGRGYAGYDL
jgi:hypothetical protein